jgi:tetratricopeptide (TPR) repeat protein
MALRNIPSIDDPVAAGRKTCRKSHYDFDLPGAKAEFLKAIEFNPNSAYTHLFYSNCYLMPMGQHGEAIAENRRALELDPLSMPINNFLGETYLLARGYSQSYKQFQHTIAMDLNFPLAHLYFASLLELMGRFEDAINKSEKSVLLVGLTPTEASERAVALRRALKNRGEKG